VQQIGVKYYVCNIDAQTMHNIKYGVYYSDISTIYWLTWHKTLEDKDLHIWRGT